MLKSFVKMLWKMLLAISAVYSLGRHVPFELFVAEYKKQLLQNTL